MSPALKATIRAIPGAGYVVWPVNDESAAVLVTAEQCEGDPAQAADFVADTLPGNRPVYIASSWGYVRLSTKGNEAIRTAATRAIEEPLVAESKAAWHAAQS